MCVCGVGGGGERGFDLRKELVKNGQVSLLTSDDFHSFSPSTPVCPSYFR